jgi:hypothetical protein
VLQYKKMKFRNAWPWRLGINYLYIILNSCKHVFISENIILFSLASFDLEQMNKNRKNELSPKLDNRHTEEKLIDKPSKNCLQYKATNVLHQINAVNWPRLQYFVHDRVQDM